MVISYIQMSSIQIYKLCDIMLSTIKNIIGRFWFQIFADSWLISNILKLFDKIIIPRLHSLQYNLKARLTLSNQNLIPYYQYSQIFIENKNIDQSLAPLTLGSLANHTFANSIKLNSYDPNYMCFQVLGDISDCIAITDNMTRNKCTKLQLYKDFQISDNKLYIPVSTYKRLQCQSKLINNNGLKHYYKLWAIKPRYDIIDRYCGILGFPSDWLIKYPNIIKLGFDIHFNGVSKLSAKTMLNTVLDNPICNKAGFIQKIQQVQNQYFITIAGIQYRSTRQPKYTKNMLKQLIKQGDTIFQGQSAQIFTQKDINLLADHNIRNISLATQVGPINIRNTQLRIQTQNVIPGTGNIDYQTLCKNSQNRPSVYIGAKDSTINPLKWLISKIWKKRFILIKLPVFDKGSDLDIVLRFLLKNIPKSCIVIVQPQLSSTTICQLDLQCSSETLQYYANNKIYQLEVQFENI